MAIHTTSGSISQRTAAFANKALLERGTPYLCLEMFGQSKPLAKWNSKTQTFRRYEALDSTPTSLTEGVTPASSDLTKTDYTATLVQRGAWVELTDVMLDTHEDNPLFDEITEILGEQAAQMLEKARFNILKAGTNVHFANGASRSAVNSKITTTLQRQVTRSLKRQNARKITKKVSASPNYSTEPVATSYVAIAHTDVESDIRDMTGFVPCEKYGSGMTPYDGEIGKVEDVRYILTTIAEPWLSAGGAAGAMLSDDSTNADVYPVLYLAKDAYGIVPFKGKYAVQTIVRNPEATKGDELAQTGSAGWKAMETSVILNDAWMARAEVAVTA